MHTLTFVTNNSHKIQEVQDIFSQTKKDITILSLADNNISIDIPEPYHTFEENSQHKAQTIYEKYHIDCFAEDSGLVVDALDGEPGVLSARYAGDHDSAKNIEKVLEKLRKCHSRETCLSEVRSGDPLNDDRFLLSQEWQGGVQEWQKKINRTAKFVAIITLIINGKAHQFRGECPWTIATERKGNLSFWYDPIFIPHWYDKPFAELGTVIKSQVSHRKQAIEQMLHFLDT